MVTRKQVNNPGLIRRCSMFYHGILISRSVVVCFPGIRQTVPVDYLQPNGHVFLPTLAGRLRLSLVQSQSISGCGTLRHRWHLSGHVFSRTSVWKPSNPRLLDRHGRKHLFRLQNPYAHRAIRNRPLGRILRPHAPGLPTKLDGIFLIRLNAEGKCTSLREWWHKQQ